MTIFLHPMSAGVLNDWVEGITAYLAGFTSTYVIGRWLLDRHLAPVQVGE
jgi:hypothetical protein